MENTVCKAVRILGMTILIIGCLVGIVLLIQGLNTGFMLSELEETLKMLKISTGIIFIISSIITWILCAWLCEMLENSIKQTENTTNLLAKINTLTNLIEKQK